MAGEPMTGLRPAARVALSLIGVVCLLAGLGLLYTTHAHDRPGDPATGGEIVEVGTLDFGDLIGSMRLEKELRVPNPGPEDWVIADVHKECGCTEVTHVSERAAAGSELSLRVAVRSGGQPPQTLDRRVFLRLESEPRLLAVRIRARVLPTLQVEPSGISLEIDPDSAEFEQTVRVVAPLDWPSPEFTAPGELSVEWADPEPAPSDPLVRHRDLRIRGHVDHSGGEVHGRIGLRLPGRDDLPGQELELPVLVRRRQYFVTVPARLALLDEGQGRALESSLRLDGHSGSDLMLSLVPEDIGQAWMDEQRQHVRLTLDPVRLSQAGECHLWIEDASGRSSKVPIELLSASGL